MTDQDVDQDAIDAELIDDDTKPIAVAGDVLPDTLYLLPLSDRPFFPAQVLPGDQLSKVL